MALSWLRDMICLVNFYTECKCYEFVNLNK